MQAISRRLTHESFKAAPSIASLKSLYPISDPRNLKLSHFYPLFFNFFNSHAFAFNFPVLAFWFEFFFDVKTIDSVELGYGVDQPRYGSTLATKGVGHLVRKGTGGRSSVRYDLFSIISHF